MMLSITLVSNITNRSQLTQNDKFSFDKWKKVPKNNLKSEKMMDTTIPPLIEFLVHELDGVKNYFDSQYIKQTSNIKEINKTNRKIKRIEYNFLCLRIKLNIINLFNFETTIHFKTRYRSLRSRLQLSLIHRVK
jgi:hypothetical protein